ncbi:Zn-finger in Ran binding protein and others family protein [Babesia bovis T2Bo]|uniref:RanBP2-type domain-containing protein n=1 Tax=Babesia bovis TaxID=5865 RepID=A7API7_BABBO|nr:Zn-finger in Ran binding protein and others family protein [Babesia bovis T2Bo]EDO08471.1 Zn-finger in Ran binding protein and others family protein [Babesia bovis T2Bo]|eukprot:XP_001612039.1 hypothetical protein [Babesia bovis T2Bo]
MCSWRRYDERASRRSYHEDSYDSGYPRESSRDYGSQYRYNDDNTRNRSGDQDRFADYQLPRDSPLDRPHYNNKRRAQYDRPDHDSRGYHSAGDWRRESTGRGPREYNRRREEYTYRDYDRSRSREPDEYSGNHTEYQHNKTRTGGDTSYVTTELKSVQREDTEHKRAELKSQDHSSEAANAHKSRDSRVKNEEPVEFDYKNKEAVEHLNRLMEYERENVNTRETRNQSAESPVEEPIKKTEWYMQPRYQKQKPWKMDETNSYQRKDRYRHSSDNEVEERENSATVLVRNLATTVSVDDVDNVVSGLCIERGTSAPNNVTLRTTEGHYGPVGESSILKSIGIGPAVERYAVVTFPSPENAARFMECVSSRKLTINNEEYYVEYDTLEVNSDVKTIESSLTYEDYQEYDAILKRRQSAHDWICPVCRFINYARRSQCFTCESERPPDEVLQKQKLLVDISSTDKTLPIHTNVSDVSSWVVLKGIPLDADPAALLLQVCTAVPQGRSTFTTESLGNACCSILPFQGSYLRLEPVKSLEKQIADNLMKNLKTNTLRVIYEYDSETYAVNLVTEFTAPNKTGNKETKTCKIRTSNVSALEQICQSSSMPPGARKYLDSWQEKVILSPGGKPDASRMYFDEVSGYLYDGVLGIYFDANTNNYISVRSERYHWDDTLQALVLSDKGILKPEPDSTQQGSQLQGLLAAALKAAQMTNKKVGDTADGKEATKSVMEPSVVTTNAPPKPRIDIAQTFDLGNQSDDECDMELEDNDKVDDKMAQPVLTPTKIDVRSVIVCLQCLRVFNDQTRLELHERRSRYHQVLMDT